ncbi:MAG: radical SAM family heme chaperone HemW [Clostridiales bacterium]|nr:radical SAM family heme chaperone HemW [Clostridiales bacterium]
MRPVGLYVHFPFCDGKCPYCDFYSSSEDEKTKTEYANAVVKKIAFEKEENGFLFDSVYFGGGTPSVMRGNDLKRIAEAALSNQDKDVLREFTVECNPSSASAELFDTLASCGVNRISMGLQSAVDGERRALGRRADAGTVSKRIKEAFSAGISNISLDLMLGIPGQTRETLKASVDFCAESGAKHISAYMLKIEEGTPFYEMGDKLVLPGEDETCDLYNEACEELEKSGFRQYEISNFALPGFESFHNLKYWNDEEYLGVGASAHSFIGGKRSYYPRDTAGFIGGTEPVQDGEGGGENEYVMLRLRLCDGLTEEGMKRRFGHAIPEKMRKAAERFTSYGLAVSDERGIRFTRKGFLVSNSLIAEIIG